MTPQQLVGLGVRLFAIWLLIRGIPYLAAIPKQLLAMSVPGAEGASSLSYGIGVTYVVLALLFWFFPMDVADRLLPRTHHDNTLSLQAHELARVGCALLGLWLFAIELPALTWFVFRAFLVTGSSSSFGILDGQTKLGVIVAMVELAIAVALIARSSSFARLITGNGARASSKASPNDL